MKLGTLRITLPDNQSRDFDVLQASIGVGRAADNELEIDEISVSRRHVRLTFEAGRMLVEDLGSANGTFIGSQRIAPNAPTLVPDNETLRVGDVELRYTPVAPPRPTSSAGANATMITGAPMAGAATRYGALRIRLPDGSTRDYAMEQPSITVGRAGENQLVIDEISVSRRHARLTVESSRLMLEDLGSANGTFIGSQRMAPNAPGLVPEDTPVRLGDVEIRYVPPAPLEAARSFTSQAPGSTMPPPGQGVPAGPPVNVSLQGPAQPVAPGSVVTATLTIQNRGAVVDEFVISISGVPANWVRFTKDRVPLLPNAQEQVTITFQPPRRAEAVATDHRFTLNVVSREHRTGLNVQGMLKVLPYQGFTLALQPVRSRRNFQVMAQNQGNAPVTYQLTAVDDEHALIYRFAQPAISLAPGDSVGVPLEVTPKVPPRIGTRETRAFNVVATAVDQTGAAEVRAPGQLIIRPPIPIWLIPVVILLLICCCVGSAYAYLNFYCSTNPTAPLCPSQALPIINVFSATPAEVDRGGAVVIAWDVSGAQTVELVSPINNTLPPSGLQTFNIENNTTFTIRATNFAGPVEQSIIVTVRRAPPTIQSFTVSPGVITAGQVEVIVLSWNVIGATAVSIEGVPGQNLGATGSVEVAAPTANTTYTLVATNDGGTVRESATVVIASADCTVANVPPGEVLYMREGPGPTYPIVIELANGTRVDPFGRNPTGDWLKVVARDFSREGWVAESFVNCTNVPDMSIYPTVQPNLIPTLAPTPTPTVTPSQVPSGTPEPTFTPSATPTPTPTPTPIFISSGAITYRFQEGGRTSIYRQGPNGARVALVFDKDDAEVLDFTPANGGRYAIWVLEGGQQKVFIISQNGDLVGGPITGAWTSITDGDWSNDGQRLVVQALHGSAPRYHYYDANGNLLGEPALP